MARRRRRNQGSAEVSYGEWLPTHAIRFNEDGTVSLMTEGVTKNPGMTEGQIKAAIRLRAPYWAKLPRSKSLDLAERFIDDMNPYLDPYTKDVLIHFSQTAIRTAESSTEEQYSLFNRGRRRNQEFYSYQSRWVPQRLMPELMNLYHTSSIIVGSTPLAKYGATVERQSWTASEFHKAHPEIKHGYIYKDLQGALGY